MSPDVIGGMAKVVRIATGEETEELDQTPASASPAGSSAECTGVRSDRPALWEAWATK